MRTLLEWILTLFLPPRGKRRACAVPTAPGRTVPCPPRSARHRRLDDDVIHADGLPLVRPYLLHAEREQERWQQRERRRALALATLGQDYVPAVSA
ncbi:hypothetical protein STSP_50890 [Streptomyces jeddahensis]|uniref:Uncharacterized protein n=1 Tax=Streptomyces jeddahensis TaxID=1716141 RepID=A0A177HMZ3_9ACTN|nr:hypothetical protein STSP_50890 [Streptomyces jeddahensis]